ncbi:MAG: SlyX family protein [Alphaproteobacteria bacterium]|nr:SlyX family protein [Alphaproteobacteria bacterium]
MNITDIENRLIEIESAIANQDKIIDDLNQMVIVQGKQIDNLVKQNQYLLSVLEDETVKPLSEETPPPHY